MMNKTRAVLSSISTTKSGFLFQRIYQDLLVVQNGHWADAGSTGVRNLSCTPELMVRSKRAWIQRKDQTDKHNEMIEIDKTDKHRYFKWKYKPLPTQTALGRSLLRNYALLSCHHDNNS